MRASQLPPPRHAGYRHDAQPPPRPAPNGDLLALAETHLTLGTSDNVAPNVQQMISLYRRIVRVLLAPHLRKGDPGEPCEGCNGQYSRADCPHAALFRRMLTDFAASLTTAASQPRGSAPHPPPGGLSAPR